MSFYKIINKYREIAESNADLGSRFEILMQAYLRTDPKYIDIFVNVWLWKDFFAKDDLGGHDTGIDLVAETVDGDFWAIQCKCLQEDTYIDKPAVDTFLSTSSRTFTDKNQNTVGFSNRLWISTSNNWSSNAKEALKNQIPPVSSINQYDLINAPVDWELLDKAISGENARIPRKTLFPHQEDALKETLAHFEKYDRGKLIMACGTGKTFTSLRIAEEMIKHNSNCTSNFPVREGINDSSTGKLTLPSNSNFPVREGINDSSTGKLTLPSNSNFPVREDINDSSTGKLTLPSNSNFPVREGINDSSTGKLTLHDGLILFLVPSIALLGQTLNEWYADTTCNINAVCICSDEKASNLKRKSEDSSSLSIVDLPLPASTDVLTILDQFHRLKNKKGLKVVFSTYQSIEKISEAQKELANILPQFSQFDLIICDEAHRTTGITLLDKDESAFVKVHDNDFLNAKKRLYMTATPRIYSPDAKSKAAQADALLCSMDDEILYGEEIYRIGFGQAVAKGLLSDYKVLILTLNENDVTPEIQKALSKDTKEIDMDDVPKLIGCINALSKQIIGDNGTIKTTDPEPMRRAVAFCKKITHSKEITGVFNAASDEYVKTLPSEIKDNIVQIKAEHIDGTMDSNKRSDFMRWLKADTEENECRILSNVRCLCEGVDVPSLDAVMFLSAKNSQIDVVQSVGRVMRKSQNKKYGYIIIPIVVPTDIEPEKALDDNERYKVVWTVLNALRAHDDRFDAVVEFNKKMPDNIMVVKPDPGSETSTPNDSVKEGPDVESIVAEQLKFKFAGLQKVLYARMVERVGNRRYLEQWAKKVVDIANMQRDRLTALVKIGEYKAAFEEFVLGLQKNINPSISESDAIEMLSQHIITKPIFEALFEDYSFVRNNPISISMQNMIDLLTKAGFETDIKVMQHFYFEVQLSLSSVNTASGKQNLISQLYEKFFKIAFPKMVEKLGIVYTPVEVVDFIIHSVNDVLKQEFGRSLSDKNVNILDPFTGTGTFITRLIQSGLIDKKDLIHKYQHEIFANEIVLLAYYIAAVNIENTFHDAMGTDNYYPFEGICLTDTFQLGEYDEKDPAHIFFSEIFPQNTERVKKQKSTDITVIIGNPPYSIGQRSANDNSQNQSYPSLDSKIAMTYAKASSASLKNALYDSYIKAFRWSTDRLGDNNGIIAFVSNGGWLDGNSTDGFRKCLLEEFTTIYVFNLRGNQRTSGELSRREGGKIFGSGSRAPITITLLVRSGYFQSSMQNKAKILYYDIGDYHTREQKLRIIKNFNTINSINWTELTPNEHGDWLNLRNDEFSAMIPLEPEKKFDLKTKSFFNLNIVAVATGRDAWVLNYSKHSLLNNMQGQIYFYNKQSVDFKENKKNNQNLTVEDFIETDTTKISWTRALRRDVYNGVMHSFNDKYATIGMHRPFTKLWLYYHKSFIESPSLWNHLFPTKIHTNLVICVPNAGNNKDFTPFITDSIVEYQLVFACQCFPLHYYQEKTSGQLTLKELENENNYIRHEAISDFIFNRAKQQYGKSVTREDIFYYVYGFLHSPEYRTIFANDLKKMLPRLPLLDNVSDFWIFSKAGRKLADLHLNYENIPHHPDVQTIYEPSSLTDTFKLLSAEEKKFIEYKVEKMKFLNKEDKTRIIYNNQISLENIPLKAYEYIVNGKSAIEWIMERYQITTHKESGITNDPNDWAKENDNPRYILDLLHSVINLSVQTVDIVKSLPKINFEKGEVTNE
ncbi:MAG: DEAD/DEAH box helicase family protein [Candidatus Cloacimonetes bacterium]|nr:DEAD/DEAH box helicase family protein [Candidatus Cloacimonadota bacterium]